LALIASLRSTSMNWVLMGRLGNITHGAGKDNNGVDGPVDSNGMAGH